MQDAILNTHYKIISNWNVAQVTDMYYTFYEAESFNQPLNNWNVSSVTTIQAMFYKATSFNQVLYSGHDKFYKLW